MWITEDGQAFEIWSGILMKHTKEEDEEIYNDDELDYGYESEAMIIEPEEYIRFPLPKALVDTTNMSKSDTSILVPRSLFDRSNLLLNTQSSSLSTNTFNKSKQTPNNNNNNNNKMFSSNIPTPITPQANIKARQLYVNNGTTTTPLPNSSNTNVIVSASTSSRPIKLEEMLSKDNFQGLLEIDNSDWLISEDYKVLDTIQNIQQLPLTSMSFSSTSNANKPQTILSNSSLSSSPLLPSSTTITTPSSSSSSSSIVNNTTNALTQNWDFISDVVNRYSRVLRTPKQCKHRFEQVIGPREEGRVVYDLIKKKKHVIKGTVKMSDDNWQMLRTNQLFVHDNCQKLLQMYHQKFDTILQFEQQLSSLIYLNKFKQIQIAQAAHHQTRGLKQGALLQENNINFDVPLTPSDVSYQRSEREKELKQQQQQQQQQQPLTQTITGNVHQQQQQIPITQNNIDTIKQQTPPPNATLASTINTRVRPSTLNTTPTPINSSPSPSLSLIQSPSPSNCPTIQRSISNNIIVASNNHSNMNTTRSQSNILPSRTNFSSSTTTTSVNSIPSSNQPSIPTATILPGQRQVQVLPTNNNLINETNSVQQKQVGTVQISSNEYRHVRALPHQHQTTATSTTNPSSTSANIQVRAQNYQRSQSQTTPLATLEVRSQLPLSPKSQQQQQPTQTRPSSTTSRASSVTQTQVDYLIQSQAKSLASSTPPSTLPVAVVRPMQHSSTSIAPTISSSSPTSPLNIPSLNVTIPSNKLTTNTTTTTTNNPTQQLRTATAFLSNPTSSSSQVQQATPQIRQLFTNANNTSLQTQQTTNTQRLTETAQRSPSSIQQIIASRTASLPGQVRNVRILTFTPGTNPTTGIADTITTNTQQSPIQSTNITYNRANSSASSFPRSTINIDQDISSDLAAQVHRIKSFNVTNTDPNDATQTPRAVLVPARTISGSSTSSVGSTSKIKPSSLIDPTTLGFTTKTSQANIVFQLPSSTSTTTIGSDEQTITNSSNVTRQNLLQHLNVISSNMNQRAQSPTTISNTTNPITFNRLLQQYQIRPAATLNSSTSTTQISSGQMINEQILSSSSPPPLPSASASSSTT
ncbi:unnamed protein product [Rotaria sordida]|uniref:Myb-like domain-containing protein n=1 Tax=Rotaria sordida TaxID=392033 RepID=A0A813YNR1_9BILA|nr:unnamed protein product [Rotaria sordida]CAF3583882.1 unnamed protein product [Rotaria sordida]